MSSILEDFIVAGQTAQKWHDQEIGMCLRRVALYHGRSPQGYTGNPMNASEAVDHMKFIRNNIRKNASLFLPKRRDSDNG